MSTNDENETSFRRLADASEFGRELEQMFGPLPYRIRHEAFKAAELIVLQWRKEVPNANAQH